jgi:hypothetical protein
MERNLAALGYQPFTPTEEQRELCRVLAFNGVAHDRIAEILEMALIELVWHFRRELDLSEDFVLAKATAAMFDLANQRNDLGVAFRANELMLRTRSPRWREPKVVEATDSVRRIEDMDLGQVEAEIASWSQTTRRC